MHIVLKALNWADLAIASIIVLSALISLMRGFVREAISLTTWIVAAWVAIRFYDLLANQLAAYIHTPSLQAVVAFAILFIATLIIGGLINVLFSRLVEQTGLSGTDRLLGLIFGIARGILLVAVLILLGSMMDLPQDPWWSASQLIPHFQGLVTWLQSFVPQKIQELSQSFTPYAS